MKEILLGHPGIVAEIFGLPPGNQLAMTRFIHTSKGKASSRWNP